MNTKLMYDLKETLCANMEQYAKKDNLSRNDLDTVHMLTDTIKNIDKITAMEEQGYSYGMGDWNANGTYSNGMMPMSHGRGQSYGDDRMSGRRSGNNYSNDAYDMENRMRREMNY